MVDGTFDNVYTNNLYPLSGSTTINISNLLSLPTQGSSGGLLIGGDCNLYRETTNTLRTDDALCVIGNLNMFGSTNLIDFYEKANTSTLLMRTHVTGESQYRFVINASGGIAWGGGSTAVDTNLYRSSANLLSTDDSFSCMQLYVGDASYNVKIAYDAPYIYFGNRSNGWDTNLYRSAQDVLKTDDSLNVAGQYLFFSGISEIVNDTANDALAINTYDYATTKDLWLKTDKVWIGGGGKDTNLYRSGANILKTDDALIIGGDLTVPNNYSVRFLDSGGNGRRVLLNSGSDNVYLGMTDANWGGFLFLNAGTSIKFYVNGSSGSFTSGAELNGDGQFRLPVTGSAGGLLIGGDANLYRSAPNTLHTNGSLEVGGSLTVNGTPVLTSGSTVSLSGLSVDGSVSFLGGLASASFSINQGTVTTIANSLDDGTGNMTVSGNLKSNEYFHSYTKQEFPDQVYYHLFKNEEGYPNTTGYITFYDLTGGQQGNNYLCLFAELLDNDPILVCSQHLAIEKDLMAKGMLNSLEGEIALNAGLYSPGWGPDTRNPFIFLNDNKTNPNDPNYVPNHFKLEIRKIVANGEWAYNHDFGQIWGWGDLACGNIDCIGVIHGGGSGPANAFRIGDDCHLSDLNQENIIGIRGVQDSNKGGFWFGGGNGGYLQKLYADGNFLYYDNTVSTQNGGLMPASAYLNLGGSYTSSAPYAWRHIYGRWIHAHDQFGCDNKTIGSYDSKDDLAIIKGLKNKRVAKVKYCKNSDNGTEEATEIEEDVIDFTELDFLHLDDSSLSINKLIGFLYGCTKALAKKQDEYDKALLKMEQLAADIAKMQSTNKPN